MSKVIITLIAIILSSSAAFAKDRINIKVEGKDVDFNHSGHAKYNKGNCNVCHPAVPQSLEPNKVTWMFCRDCHDQSLRQGGLKPQPIKK